MTTTNKEIICNHCNHEEHLDTKCYKDDCDCIDCHTKNDIHTDPEALFNGA